MKPEHDKRLNKWLESEGFDPKDVYRVTMDLQMAIPVEVQVYQYNRHADGHLYRADDNSGPQVLDPVSVKLAAFW
jgi:hypothetical protein